MLQRCATNRAGAANCAALSTSRPDAFSRRGSVACAAASGSSQDPLLLRVARGEGGVQCQSSSIALGTTSNRACSMSLS